MGGDAAVIAATIVEMLDGIEARPSGFASADLAARLAARSDADFTDRSTDRSIDLRTALLRVEAAFPTERTIVYDGGRFVRPAFTILRSCDPRGFVHTVNIGSIGLGMGTAIGAAVGRPDRPVLAVCGDGGFMMAGLTEFATAVRHRLDVVVVVLNDGAFGAEHIQFVNRQLDPAMSTFEWPDLGPVATALGGTGFTVRNLAELDAALARIPDRTGPLLIDVKLDPDRVPSSGH